MPDLNRLKLERSDASGITAMMAARHRSSVKSDDERDDESDDGDNSHDDDDRGDRLLVSGRRSLDGTNTSIKHLLLPDRSLPS